jgi:hypothetical protein
MSGILSVCEVFSLFFFLLEFSRGLFYVEVVDDAFLANLLIVDQCVVVRLVAAVVSAHE